MNSLDIAKANVAASALERCLRIRRSGGFCDRLTFRVEPRGFDHRLAIVLGVPVLVTLAFAIVAHL